MYEYILDWIGEHPVLTIIFAMIVFGSIADMFGN